MITNYATTRRRLGLSLMEVLFAIGVLMVGILGIASVLPIALRNASSALRTDETAAAIENQISNVTARLGGRPTEVIVVNPSQVVFNGVPASADPPDQNEHDAEAPLTRQWGGLFDDEPRTTPAASVRNELLFSGTPPAGERYRSVPISELSKAFPSVEPLDPSNFAAPSAPVAFCVDPAFVVVSDNINLRDDLTAAVGSRNLNSYDRTKFPCYDINYNPLVAPGLQMNPSTAWPITPRMVRVSYASDAGTTVVPPSAVANVLLGERDGLPVTRPADRTLPPSLNFRRVGLETQFDTQRSGRFSSIVMYVPLGTNYRVFVVVYENRELALFNESTLQAEFNMAPHTNTTWPLRRNTNFVPSTYPGEVLGMVTNATGIIQNGTGRFTFAHSNTANPEIKVGQWLMLARHVPGSPVGANRFAWYRVTSVLDGPRQPSGDHNVVDGSPVYVTEVEVAGEDWVFHPQQISLGAIPDYSALGVPGRQAITVVMKAPQVVAVSSFML
jgi:hypothetical protein